VAPGSTTARSPSLERVDDIAAAWPQWSALARASDNIFATPEWLTTWWRHFGSGSLELWRAYGAGGAEVLLPLWVHDGVARFLGHGQGDQLGPVCRPEDRAAGAAALGRLLDDGSLDWHTFVGADLPASVDWGRHTGAEVEVRTASPEVALGPHEGWDAFLLSRSPRFRQQARARERRLAAGPAVRFAICADPDELPAALDTLFALHRARWGPDHAHEFAERAQAFHRDFAATALEREWLRLAVLEIGGQPAASLLNFRFGTSESFYQGGRDPRFSAAHPGLLCHLRAIRAANDDGLDAYRLLRGDEPYKLRLATRDPGLVTIRRARDA
jgi:CelD/BcsL family acetyltransferase involved in cellulose biosynthesis